MTDGYSPVPTQLITRTVEELADLTDKDERKFVEQMAEFFDTNAEEYNPDFRFKKGPPEFADIVLVYESSSKKLVGGHIYMIREVVYDNGSAWIMGTFDYAPFEYVGTQEDRDDPIRWYNY